MSEQQIYIPDCLSNWKWPRQLNPHYLEVKEASAAWLRSFKAFSPKKQYAYDVCDFNLLASLAYPLADKERLRTACDLMHVFFVFDEYSDVSSPAEVRQQADIIMDALRHPHKARPDGEWVGGEVTRQFWERAITTASAQAQKRFVETFGDYTSSVVEQATHRATAFVPTVDGYLAVRRDTIGAKPSFAMLELDMDIPDEIIGHPVIQELTVLAIDMIVLGNDITSYNKEQACGDDLHNMVTIATTHFHTDVPGAMAWIAEHHKALDAKFAETYLQVPRWGGPVDRQVARYVDGLANWVRASDQWGFESARYFGRSGREVQETRCVGLLPKTWSPEGEVGPQLVDASTDVEL